MKTATVFLVLATGLASATTPICLPLPELLNRADHVFVGTVLDVVAVNEAGQVFTGPSSGTLWDTLRIEFRMTVRVDRERILKTNLEHFPDYVVVRYGRGARVSLSSQRERWVDQDSVFTLKGREFSPATGGFVHPMSMYDKVKQLIERGR